MEMRNKRKKQEEDALCRIPLSAPRAVASPSWWTAPSTTIATLSIIASSSSSSIATTTTISRRRAVVLVAPTIGSFGTRHLHKQLTPTKRASMQLCNGRSGAGWLLVDDEAESAIGDECDSVDLAKLRKQRTHLALARVVG
jgi:hypothetical protein